MTREEVFTKIWSWHNHLYRYNEDNYIILGYCDSSEPQNINHYSQYEIILDKLIEIYEKGTLSDNDKLLLAKEAHRITKWCDYNFEGKRTKQEQKEFIDSLTDQQLGEIIQQIDMYTQAHEAFIANRKGLL